MSTLEQLQTEIARLAKHRSHLRAQRLTAWFYRRGKLEAKVYQRLAKLDTRIQTLTRQMTRKDK